MKWRVMLELVGPNGTVSVHEVGGRAAVAEYAPLAQPAKSWPDAMETDRQAGTRLTETIERIRWRLWHGQVRRALDLIGETVVIMVARTEDTPAMAAAARKVARLLGDLETYVPGQSAIIIDYATARRCEEPISTAITESTVQWLLHRRMNVQQQMRWSRRGADLLLHVRCAVYNGTFGSGFGQKFQPASDSSPPIALAA